jgi:DNA-binding response OmpR family regulator
MKVLLVEDDLINATVLSKALTNSRYTVDLASDGEKALNLAIYFEYDLILLDIMIPKIDGINLCRRLRQQNRNTPILLLTAKDSKADIISGLDAGADDYLIKPYDLLELMARMRSLLRRSNCSVSSVLNWGALYLNPVSGEVTYKNQKVPLTAKEYNLLELFLRNPQRLYSRSAILDLLWTLDELPIEKTVTTHIKDIRKKLKAVGCTDEIIETVYGIGYRLKSPSSDASERKKDLTSLDIVLERYKDTFTQQIAVLEQANSKLLDGKLTVCDRQNSEQEAHKLAGSLGTFGYPKGSQLAREIELLLMEDKPLGKQEALHIEQSIHALKMELKKPPLFPENSHSPIPLNTKVLLIDDDTALCEKLKTEALLRKIEIEIAYNIEMANINLSKAQPDIILLNLTFSNSCQDGLEFLEKCREKFPKIPVLVFSGRDDLSVRVQVSRLKAEKFLHKPMLAEEIFQKLAEALPQNQAPAKVMLVDDDRTVLTLLRHRLSSLGLEVTTLRDPQQFWQVLSATMPDLLILDLEMPSYSGLELCQVVRQDARWEDLPIFLVTAHTDTESIQQGFAAGADDFIGKPIREAELSSRILSRIKRSRSRKNRSYAFST